MEQYSHLFSPLKIGSMTVSNRISFNAQAPRFYPGHEAPNERAIRYWEARAKGGTGLIVTASHYVVPPCTAITSVYQDDKVIPALKKVTEAIHQYGTKVIAQITSLGRHGSSLTSGGVVWGPSPVADRALFPARFEVPHEMDIDEIKQVIRAYGTTARIMKEARYDGVEISAVTGLLVASFMSSHSNFRTDEYGGSLENRLRFPLELFDAIRAEVGRDFVLGIKWAVDEFVENGLTLEESKAIAQKFEATGKLDYLTAGAGIGLPHCPPMYFPLGCFAYLAAGLKEVVNLPVFCGIRINDPVQAEAILDNNQADMIGMVRALICDPEWPNKAREGRLDEIRRCIACNEACVSKHFSINPPLSCAFNPEAGREREFAIVPAETKKKVMVVGGGAAGLETARVAALRGHQVSLFEKENLLGGQVNIAAKAPERESFEEITRYYTYQMKLLGVDIHLGVVVTPEVVESEHPDAVVVATGSIPLMPEISGGDGCHTVEVREVLEGRTAVGQNVVVIAGEHHTEALTTADFLAAEKGKKVEILTDALQAGSTVDSHTLEVLYTRLLSKGVIITPLTKVKEVQGNTIITYNVLTGSERRIEGVDTIVAAMGGKADDTLYRCLKGKAKELYSVGHCLAPRKLRDSILDGATVGRIL